ncbi:MAG: hypothetical protein IKD04_09495 [Clostridia bacterium]|nr:hypothetical protein [Clostridia bacterium]
MKKAFSFLLIFVILLTFSSCSAETVSLSKAFDTKAKSATFGNATAIENSSLRLEWDETTNGVILTDLKTGIKWSTSPEDEGGQQLDEFGMPIKKHPKVNSMLVVSYLDTETNTVVETVSYTAAVENGRIRCAKSENSLLVEFYFDAPQFMIPVQYILKDDHLQIKINTKDIQEGENRIIKISLAPFLCSAKNDSEDTYLFVPSGSGALIKPTTISQQGVNYSTQVYGEDSSIEKLSQTTETQSARLPVFGARISKEKGMLAIIDASADSALVEVTSGASAYGYSTVYASFQLRGYTGHVANLFSGLRVENTIYSKQKINEKLAVSFYPLMGENADYSGMAELYRKYLQKKSGMPDSCEDYSLNLTFLGGMMVTDSFCGIPYEKLYTTTTFEQISDILTELSQELKIPFNAVLKGFSATGVDVGAVGGGFRLGKGFGSKKELNQLKELCQSNDIGLYVDFELARFNKTANGFSTFSDSSYNASGEQRALQYLYNAAVLKPEENTRHYLLDPARLGDAFEKLLNSAEKLELDGVSLSTLTSISYSNYKDRQNPEYYSKNGFGKTVSENLQQLKKNKLKIAACAANAYAAAVSDIVLDAPTESDREHIFYTDVPFYQMVFKGSVPLSVKSVNLSADADQLLLKAVEGCSGLSYTLIDNWSNELITSDHPDFYNSVYSELKDKLVANVAKLSDYYKKTDGAHITAHELLSEALRMTEFDNGVTVYVNFGDEAVISPAGRVEAKSFLVAEGVLS